jgi:crossover junction endodeoxyribonuclease RusA
MTRRVIIPFPPSVNSMYLNVRGKGRVKTPEYREWIAVASMLVAAQNPVPPKGRAFIRIKIDDTRQGDADGRIKAAVDLLVRCGILQDDRKKYVRKVSIEWAKVEGCEIYW